MKKVIAHARTLLLSRSRLPISGFLVFLFIILYINTFHEQYTDEFDNILGGWYILHGYLPYSGFFTHHGPIPYFISAVMTLFSGNSFVKFRIIYSFVLFGFLTYTYVLLSRRWGEIKSRSYLLTLGVLAIGSTYYWLHMFIADNISALFFLPVFAILFLRTIYHEKLSIQDFVVSSLFLFLGLLSSLTYMYMVLGFYLYIAYYYFRSNRGKVNLLEIGKIIGIFAVPYIVFGGYLLVTGSLKDYVYQSITFNQKYYIYNIPRRADGSLVNPLRAAVFILHEFLNNYTTLLVQVKDFNFSYPLNITFAIGNLAMLYYLLSKRKFAFSLFLFWVLAFANARSNPLTSSVRDYQSAVYIFLSVFNSVFVLTALFKDVSEKDIALGQKILDGIFLGVVGVYSLFSLSFIVNQFNNTFYPKYMGNAPLIYDRPEIAPILNKITTKDDYMWVGPFEFQELLYMNGRLASKYHVLNPGMGKSDKISAEQVAEIEQTKPKYIWFNPNFYILGYKSGDYGVAFTQMLNKDYVSLYDYRKENKKYVSLVPITLHVDLEKYLFLRKENASEEIDKLLAANLIKEVAAK